MAFQQRTYTRAALSAVPKPNRWDIAALVFLFAIIFAFGWGASRMAGHFHVGEQIQIHLSAWYLPYYALRTFLRMMVALICSLAFTFIFATWAAKSKRAERLIIPFIDIMQSVPVLGFLSISMVVFIVLFKGSMMGPEAAAIFAIFTAQVWNMALSLYQSLCSVPDQLIEAADMFQLSPWQRYWKVEVPFAMPSLLWNTMMSMSSSWVFLVASEAITVDQTTVRLPGIGSYIDLAIAHKNIPAICYVILAMLLVILLYDQLMFRPLVAWAEKFKIATVASEVVPTSWVLDYFQKTIFFQHVGRAFEHWKELFLNHQWFQPNPRKSKQTLSERADKIYDWLWNAFLISMVVAVCWVMGRYIFHAVPFKETLYVAELGLASSFRIICVMIVVSIIWVPIGVWIGMNPKATQFVQPIVQFLAAFPANLLFPAMVLLILHYQLNVNIWSSPLMMLGTQWFLLFNIIAGANAIPKNLQYVAGTMHLKGWNKWRRFIIPAIFPYYITGAMTAMGGAWNYTIIVEAIKWGHTSLYSTGLGAYITRAYTVGNFPKLALGIVVMSIYVVVFDRIVWHPLHLFAEKRFMIK